ncbi:unnamed protein product, partial [Echinostoma caproni]|uniref:Cyclin-T n=1 Tax=Echinostoma caproni TaxID=27848 RepID=A0A183BG40_9TREM
IPSRHYTYEADPCADCCDPRESGHVKIGRHHKSHKEYSSNHEEDRPSRKRHHLDDWSSEEFHVKEEVKRKKKHKKHSRSHSKDRKSRHDKRHDSPECTDINTLKYRTSLMSELTKHQNFREKLMKSRKKPETKEKPIPRSCPLDDVPLPPVTEASNPPQIAHSAVPLEEIALPPEPASSKQSEAKPVATGTRSPKQLNMQAIHNTESSEQKAYASPRPRPQLPSTSVSLPTTDYIPINTKQSQELSKKPSISELPLPPGFETSNLNSISPETSTKLNVNSPVKRNIRGQITQWPNFLTALLVFSRMSGSQLISHTSGASGPEE